MDFRGAVELSRQAHDRVSINTADAIHHTLGELPTQAAPGNHKDHPSLSTPGALTVGTDLTVGGYKIQANTGTGGQQYAGLNIVNGSRSGYSGFRFQDEAVTFMVDGGGATGMYNDNATWRWYFDASGILQAGTIPAASIRDGAINLPSGSLSAAYVGGGRIATGYDSAITGAVSASNWFRSNGQSGWYNDTYGHGIYLSDTTWVRTYPYPSYFACSYIDATGEIVAHGASRTDLNFFAAGQAGAGTVAAYINASGAYTRSASSKKHKRNIVELDESLIDNILKLQPVSFEWNPDSETAQWAKDPSMFPDDKIHPGFIAEQALESGLDLWVTLDENGEPETFDYPGFTSGLLLLCKKLSARIDELEQKVNG